MHRPILPVLIAVSYLGAACSDSTGPRSGPPANLIRTAGDDQEGTVGAALSDSLALRVTDAEGDPVPNAAVTWAVTAGGGTVNPDATSTDSDGRARTLWTLGPTAGDQTVMASVAELPMLEFKATGLAGPAVSAQKGEGDDQTAPGGCRLSDLLVVRVADEFDNAVQGIAVDWSVTAGGGSLSVLSATTDGDGQAEAIWRLGEATGSQSAAATVAGLTAAEFTATATAAATAEPSSMSMEYSGDDEGSFTASGELLRCPAPQSVAGEAYAFSNFDENGNQLLWAFSQVGEDRGDIMVIVIEGAVAGPGPITWDWVACDEGDASMCGADGFISLGFQLDEDPWASDPVYYFDTGTIEFAVVGSDRLEGVFAAEGFTYDQSGPSGRMIDVTDGAFDIPVFPEPAGGTQTAGALFSPDADGGPPAAIRRLAERIRARR